MEPFMKDSIIEYPSTLTISAAIIVCGRLRFPELSWGRH